MFDAGSIVGKLGLDVSGYTQGMLQAQGIASLFPAVVTNFLANPLLGLITVASQAASAIKSAFLDIGQAADDAGEMAERVGVSVEFLTGVGRVAADAGSSMQGLADSMKFLNNNAADAAQGSKTATKAFADLGISVKDGAGKIKSSESLFFEVANAIAAMDAPAQKTQAAMNLLGRGGTDLIPTLNKGGSAIQQMAAQMKALGGTFDEEEAKLGDTFGTLSTHVDAALQGIKKAVAVPLLKLLGDNAEEVQAKIMTFSVAIREGIAGAIQFVKPIFEAWLPMIKSLGGLLLELGKVVGTVLVPVFKLLEPQLIATYKVLSVVFDLISKILSGIGTVVRGVSEIFGLATPEGVTAGGGGGQRAAAGVNIEKVQVAAVDPVTASSQIARQILPQIRAAQLRQARELSGAMSATAMERGLA